MFDSSGRHKQLGNRLPVTIVGDKLQWVIAGQSVHHSQSQSLVGHAIKRQRLPAVGNDPLAK